MGFENNIADVTMALLVGFPQFCLLTLDICSYRSIACVIVTDQY